VTPALRDFLVLFAAVAAAIIVGAVAQRFFDPRWQVVFGVAALFAAAAVVKWRWPAHRFLARFSWPYFIAVFVLFEMALVLLADWTIVGVYWTIPAVVCLGLLYCVIHIALSRRRG